MRVVLVAYVMMAAGCTLPDPDSRVAPTIRLQEPTTENLAQPDDDAMVGTYYRGDGSGFNLTLSLIDGGTFTCKWKGCLGDYGTSAGTWKKEGNQIVTHTTTEDGKMKDTPLGNLIIIRDNGKPLLVQSNDREFFDKHGVSEYACFSQIGED